MNNAISEEIKKMRTMCKQRIVNWRLILLVFVVPGAIIGLFASVPCEITSIAIVSMMYIQFSLFETNWSATPIIFQSTIQTDKMILWGIYSSNISLEAAELQGRVLSRMLILKG
jgi:hypothetical protein